ncbi:protoporphyrinogen oxidase HemJ [Candidatus Bandiella numerosa]|uniref:protoporphyrinogen oxidase HemJ n=1 Tax=Candidatus Bandiella numerosa TaxID=2570586 RepID=UPI001F198DD8
MFESYLFIKAFHIVSIISWMAGLLYLPRIFVYHTKTKKNSEADNLFKIMEKKLLRFIMLPAFLSSLVTGLILIYIVGFKGNIWLHIKLLFVICLIYTHHLMAKYAKNFANNKNQKSEKYFRIFNEIPAILMIIIVFLAIVKNF